MKQLKDAPIIHLVISEMALETLKAETDYSETYLTTLADYTYHNRDLGARIASGSFLNQGMVVLPCSMKTVSSVANGYSDTLISRACDVTLKEGRTLILCPRETPLNAIHLENLLKLARLGVRIIPPMPAFYNQPQTIDDLIEHHIMKIMDHLNLEHDCGRRWKDNKE